MKILLVTLNILFSASVFAQPTVTGRTLTVIDTIVVLPTNSITLTGTAFQSNPGHPILDTTWTKTAGPSAVITNSHNRMTTSVTGLVEGSYVFTLTATDKQKSASSTVNVKVIPGLLPLALSYFNASRTGDRILLTWRTDMESNNSLFIIQKSNNGSQFADIAAIASKAKGGNSSTPLTYTYQIDGGTINADMNYMVLVMTLLAFITLLGRLNKVYKSMVLGIVCLFLFSCSKSVSLPDNTPNSSKTEFRLKQVDLNGHINYSEIKLVN